MSKISSKEYTASSSRFVSVATGTTSPAEVQCFNVCIYPAPSELILVSTSRKHCQKAIYRKQHYTQPVVPRTASYPNRTHATCPSLKKNRDRDRVRATPTTHNPLKSPPNTSNLFGVITRFGPPIMSLKTLRGPSIARHNISPLSDSPVAPSRCLIRQSRLYANTRIAVRACTGGLRGR